MTENERIDLYENTPPTDDEQPETETTAKAGVAVWEYRNSDEDFDRLIVVSMQGLKDQVDAGTLDPEDVPKILYGMEGMANALKSQFNLMPKSPEFDNKKPNDFKSLRPENS